MNKPTFLEHAKTVNDNAVLGVITEGYNYILRRKANGTFNPVNPDEEFITLSINFPSYKKALVRFFEYGKKVRVMFYTEHADQEPAEFAIAEFDEKLWG